MFFIHDVPFLSYCNTFGLPYLNHRFARNMSRVQLCENVCVARKICVFPATCFRGALIARECAPFKREYFSTGDFDVSIPNVARDIGLSARFSCSVYLIICHPQWLYFIKMNYCISRGYVITSAFVLFFFSNLALRVATWQPRHFEALGDALPGNQSIAPSHTDRLYCAPRWSLARHGAPIAF